MTTSYQSVHRWLRSGIIASLLGPLKYSCTSKLSILCLLWLAHCNNAMCHIARSAQCIWLHGSNGIWFMVRSMTLITRQLWNKAIGHMITSVHTMNDVPILPCNRGQCALRLCVLCHYFLATVYTVQILPCMGHMALCRSCHECNL